MNSVTEKEQVWALLNQGKPGDSLALCQQLIGRQKGPDPELFYLLGHCFVAAGKYPEAAAAFHRSLRIYPDSHRTHMGLAGVMVRVGQDSEAVEHLKSAIELEPRLVEAHCLLGDVLGRQGLTVDAEGHYEKARALNPELARPYLGLGNLKKMVAGNYRSSIPYYEAALQRDPGNPACHTSLGIALSETRDNEDMVPYFQRARDCFLEALSLAPEHIPALSGMALVLSQERKYEEALEYVLRVRDRGVLDVNTAITFATICKYFQLCDQAVEYGLSVLGQKSLPDMTVSALSMHMARLLDKLGRYEEAWPYFVNGNKMAAKLTAFYDPAGFRLRVEKTIETFSGGGAFALPRSDCKSERPVFIVGMPRSGTSLAEQILSTHPGVCGGGELTFLSDIMHGLPQRLQSKNAWPECAGELTVEALNHMAEWYLDKLDTISKTAARVTDKMPHNFSELGLLQLVFPRARVIHCVRDPRDTCLSIYFQNFLIGHDYSRDLYNIGTHYHQYQSLMDYWKRSLAIPILEVRYEDLVTDPEPVVRGMLEFCDLDWYGGCLEFHKSRRLVHTASHDQVNQPLYKGSMERWRHYEAHLEELNRGLERGF